MIIKNMTCPYCGFGVSFDDFENHDTMLIKLLFLKRYCHRSCYDRFQEMKRNYDY